MNYYFFKDDLPGLLSMGHCEQKCYLVDMYIQLSRITSMIRVFFLPQNYHCPTMNDNYGTVVKINQELNLISALILFHFLFH